MIMKLNSFLKTHAVAIAAVIFAGGVMSFKTMEKKAATSYFYNSNSTAPGAFANPNNYGTSNSGGCITNGSRPCEISVPDDSSLDDVLSGKNNTQVLNMSINRKL